MSSNLCINTIPSPTCFPAPTSGLPSPPFASRTQIPRRTYKDCHPKCLKPGVDVTGQEKWVLEVRVLRATSAQTGKMRAGFSTSAPSWVTGTESVTGHTPAALCNTVTLVSSLNHFQWSRRNSVKVNECVWGHTDGKRQNALESVS